LYNLVYILGDQLDVLGRVEVDSLSATFTATTVAAGETLRNRWMRSEGTNSVHQYNPVFDKSVDTY
jgi:hypothetical protein